MNFTESCPLGAVLICADRQTDRQIDSWTDMTKLIGPSCYCEYA